MTDHSQNQPTLMMNDERQIPQLGFGTWEIAKEDAKEAVSTALDAGFWMVDTAAIYRNEEEVGQGIGDWSDIFLQTKIWNDSQGYDRTLKAADKCLQRLGRDHVDMLLIHWPQPEKNLFVETWKAFIELRDAGKAKSIGVSNFREEDLKRVVDETGVVPALNQIELHPSFQQRELRGVHDEMNIVTQSWSPLGQGKAIGSDAVQSIAKELDQSPAAVIIRWHIQHGLSTLPRSTNPDHIRDNFTALDFELSEDQMARIDDLDSADGRMGPEPGSFND